MTSIPTSDPILRDTTILIPAAGSGERLGLGPKAALVLAGEPLLGWVSRKALSICPDVVVAVPTGETANYAKLCQGCRCIDGGQSRQETVENLARRAEKDYALIVDVARPFASRALCEAVLNAARLCGAAGAFLQPDVPVALLAGTSVTQMLPRTQAGILQAPQAFSRPLLLEIIDRAHREGWEEQSILQLAVRAGLEVAAVPGEKTNIKLTTAEDWHLAQQLTEHLQ